MRITIVGAGLMGAQIGCEYALGGHEVMLVARDAEKARTRVAAGLALVEDHGLASSGVVEDARGRMTIEEPSTGLARRCELAVESVPEDVDLKAGLLRQVAASSPDAILASNTSSIPITTLGEAVGVDRKSVV